MSTRSPTDRLIHELLADPAEFKRRGRAYQLLEAYFTGLELETLRPLLRHEDALVRHAAVWVAAELGKQGCPLLEDVVPLAESSDRFLCYHALEVLMVCAVGRNAKEFLRVARAMESGDQVIRNLAMRLMARADQSQLDACLRFAAAGRGLQRSHEYGLAKLTAKEAPRLDELARMLDDADPLIRRYGAVAMKRRFTGSPVLRSLSQTSPDSEIRQLLSEAGTSADE